MASDDELRANLTGTLTLTAAYRNARDVADALMPVIREALADAWDDGWEAGTHYDQDNPWRKDQP